MGLTRSRPTRSVVNPKRPCPTAPGGESAAHERWPVGRGYRRSRSPALVCVPGLRSPRPRSSVAVCCSPARCVLAPPPLCRSAACPSSFVLCSASALAVACALCCNRFLPAVSASSLPLRPLLACCLVLCLARCSLCPCHSHSCPRRCHCRCPPHFPRGRGRFHRGRRCLSHPRSHPPSASPPLVTPALAEFEFEAASAGPAAVAAGLGALSVQHDHVTLGKALPRLEVIWQQ